MSFFHICSFLNLISNKDTVNEQHEYFGEVLLGIKHIIQNHLQEVQVKFQDKFNDMELEIHKRDDIIMQLQQKIRQLEAPDRLSFGGSHEHLNSTDSSQENPFGVRIIQHQLVQIKFY